MTDRISNERLAELMLLVETNLSAAPRTAGDLIVALRELQTLRAWQPIETAPTDGSPVWVYGGRHRVATIVEADGEYWRWCVTEGSLLMPTHWMPAKLPEPPYDNPNNEENAQ